LTEAHVENEIDTSPENTRCKERKLHDMTIRLDSLYDIMVESEKKTQS
jgi:site-specific DNA recombinase